MQVAIRALGFEVKKADVQKILKDCDKEGKRKITFQDFNEISKLCSLLYIHIQPGISLPFWGQRFNLQARTRFRFDDLYLSR